MTPSEQIDKKITELGDWRGELYARLRAIINETVPQLTETWKWETAVWQRGTNVCALGAFKDHVKLNFFKGASLDDPEDIFNGGLDSKASRSIDFFHDSPVEIEPIKKLLLQAAA